MREKPEALAVPETINQTGRWTSCATSSAMVATSGPDQRSGPAGLCRRILAMQARAEGADPLGPRPPIDQQLLAAILKAQRILPSTSSRGNSHDNTVAESFFSGSKQERIKRQIYPTRAATVLDVFDYIEMFYNPIRRDVSAGGLPPVKFEEV